VQTIMLCTLSVFSTTTMCFALHPAIAELSDGGVGVGEQALFISGGRPRRELSRGHHCAGDLVLVGVNQCVQRSTVDQSFSTRRDSRALTRRARSEGTACDRDHERGGARGSRLLLRRSRGRQEIAPICGHLPSSAVD